MRRFICIIISLAILCSIGSTFAEQEVPDITLIAGLKYGMTFDEAQKISGYDAKDMQYYEANAYEQFGIANTHFLEGKGNIGGYDALVKVYFDSDNKLIQVVYQLGIESFDNLPESVEESEVLQSDYVAVEDSLQKIYGDTTDREYPVTKKHGFFKMDASILVFNYLDYDYSARMKRQSDGNSVLIEHNRYLNFYQSGHMIGHEVSYTFYSGDYTQEPSNSDSIGF